MQESPTSSRTTADQSHRPKFVAIDHLKNRINVLREPIARRAFEIFQRHGSTNGSDLDDWLQAEAELCQSVRVEVTELDDALIVHAAVAACSADDLEVCVEPLRLIITGKRAASGEEASSDQILVVFSLRTAVDPTRVAATLQNDILELVMAKLRVSDLRKRGGFRCTWSSRKLREARMRHGPEYFSNGPASQFKTRQLLSSAWYSVINDSILLGEEKL
jgi:HSP20 family molecular chaperone IbpA